MPTLLRQESQNRNPSLAGITLDTIVVRFKLEGLLADDWDNQPILSKWRESKKRLGAKWALQHEHLSQCSLRARGMWDVAGKLEAGYLTLELSCSEMIGRALQRFRKKDNTYKASPQECFDALFSFIRGLEHAWELADFELWERHEVTRVDVCADVWTDDPAAALAVYKNRSALIARRAEREQWSFETQDTPHSYLIPRGAPPKGRSLTSTQPTVAYNKGKQLKREDLRGLVRLEAKVGTGEPNFRAPMKIPQVCSWDFWTRTLRERLLELGLPKDVTFTRTTAQQVMDAILALVAEGVSPAQASLYAAAFFQHEKAKQLPPRALRDNRKQVESKTPLRLSALRTSPTYIPDLHALIDAAPPPHVGVPSLITKIARLVGVLTWPETRETKAHAAALNAELDRVPVHELAPGLPAVHDDDHDDDLDTDTMDTATPTTTNAPPLHDPHPLAHGAPPLASGDRAYATAGIGLGPGVESAQGEERPRRYKLPSTGAKPRVQGRLSAEGQGATGGEGTTEVVVDRVIYPRVQNAPDLSPGHPAGPSRPPRRSEGSGETPAPPRKRPPEPAPPSEPDPIELLTAICEDWSTS